MEAAFWGFLGTIVGATASIATTVLASRNAANLQLATAELEREEKARSFQRDALIELHAVVHDELKVAVRIHRENVDVYREKGTWGKQMLNDELDRQEQSVRGRAALLSVRISDDGLREHLKTFQTLLTQPVMTHDASVAERMHEDIISMGTEILEHIGRALRSLDSGGKPTLLSK